MLVENALYFMDEVQVNRLPVNGRGKG